MREVHMSVMEATPVQEQVADGIPDRDIPRLPDPAALDDEIPDFIVCHVLEQDAQFFDG
jgi:hypothetical protein